MSIDFINQCTEVLNNFNHSKKEEKEGGDFYSQMKYKFRPNKHVTYEGAETYLNRFKSFLYYEWSKRKQTYEPFNLWVSCLVVSNQYMYRYDDVFLFDENETKLTEKVNYLYKILDFFFFPDVEVYFFLEDGTDERESRMHLIEDLLRKKEEFLLKDYGFCSIIEEELKRSRKVDF